MTIAQCKAARRRFRKTYRSRDGAKNSRREEAKVEKIKAMQARAGKK